MVKNEQTSKLVASYAAEILKTEKPTGVPKDLWDKILSVAGSALTQAPDKQVMSIADYYAALAVKSQAAEQERIKKTKAAISKYWDSKK
jgi:hypothetical protein